MFFITFLDLSKKVKKGGNEGKASKITRAKQAKRNQIGKRLPLGSIKRKNFTVTNFEAAEYLNHRKLPGVLLLEISLVTSF